MTDAQHKKLDGIAHRAARRSDTAQVRFAIFQPSNGLSWHWTEPDACKPYFIASITKLFTTSIVLQHIDEGRYRFNTPAAQLLPEGTLQGLVADEDASSVTVEHLLSHTSGIRDYFEAKRADGSTLIGDLAIADQQWSPVQALDMVRGADPLGSPGKIAKAHYSDTNFQLLGLIIEQQELQPYANVVAQRISVPLDLKDTYVFTAADAARTE